MESSSSARFTRLRSAKATASTLFGEVPQTPSNYYSNMPSSPSMMNYMPVSTGGSFTEPKQDSAQSVNVEKTQILYQTESIGSLVSSFKEEEGPWVTHRFHLSNWDTKLEKDIPDETSLNEFDGVLTKQIVAKNLSRIRKIPEFSDDYAYTKCVLVKKKLTNIDCLGIYQYLQYLDVSSNKLTTLKPLENLRFLKILDASHNLLTSVLDFKAPFFLTNANLSYNRFKQIRDLSEFWSLTDLNLSHNFIKAIEGLKNLRYLTSLKLSSNRIETLENLDNLRVQFLCLQDNIIKMDETDETANLDTLVGLRTINLCYNRISSLKAFENVSNLESLDIVNNNISKLVDIYYLRRLKFLNKLNLTGNPVTNVRRYVEVCLMNIKNLALLDGEQVNSDFWLEKLSNVMGKDQPQTAGHERLRLLMLEQLNPPQIWNWLLPFDRPPLAVIVLVGLQASRRAYTARKFCNHHKNVVVGIPHTTKPRHSSEGEGDYFYYITRDKFLQMLKKGEFLTYQENVGNYYGIAHREFKKAEKATIMFYTDLTMALAIKRKFFNTVLVLAVPSTRKAHLERLSNLFALHLIDKNTFKIQISPAIASVCQRTFEAEKQRMSDKLEESTLDDNNKSNGKNSHVGHLSQDDDVEKYDTDTNSSNSIWETQLDLEAYNKASLSDIIQIWWAHTPAHSLSMIIQPTALSSVFIAKNANVNGDSESTTNLAQKSTQLKNIVSSIVSRKGSTTSLAKAQQSTKLARDSPKTTIMKTSEKIETLVFSDDKRSRKLGKSASVTIQDTCAFVMSKDRETAELMKYEGYAEILSRDHRMKAFFDEELRKRDELLELHLQMPGLFREVLFTDEEEETSLKLQNLVKNVHRYNDTTKQAMMDFHLIADYSPIVKTRIDDCFSEIRKEVSISEKQEAEYKPKAKDVRTCGDLCRTTHCPIEPW